MNFSVMKEETEIVDITKKRTVNKYRNLFIFWFIVLILYGGILISINSINKSSKEQKIIQENQKKINNKSKQSFIKVQNEQYNIKEFKYGDKNMNNIQNQYNKLSDEQKNKEQYQRMNQLNKNTEIDSQVQNGQKNENEHLLQGDNHDKIEVKRNDQMLCQKGYYMDKNQKECQHCEEKCSECLHISGTCYRCHDEYYLNNYGKCIQNCEQIQFNSLITDDNKNETIPFCIGKDHNTSLYMGVQKSQSTHFVMPYLIIHPASTIFQVYHNNYPIVYYFNKDLFHFGDNIKLYDILQEAQDRLLIVVILACHTLYDFPLFNTFLFQNAIQNIEQIIKANNTTFRSYFGQDYNGYGVIRQYISQNKKNTVDLIISDDPSKIPQEEIEQNQLITQETQWTYDNFQVLYNFKPEKTIILIQYTIKNNEQDNYCDQLYYVSFVLCQIREIQINRLQLMKQNFEFISQFVVQFKLE
ncbi:unnamed protein product [Paramecium sonneborni]|uniref:Uncharacterized protein n=1 Tax=Paramecium sonneborni TaxID=65129 RepID=A0A8S1MTA0_9CILI|nr:unnamed protein product [Paramecium sonneborni]